LKTANNLLDSQESPVKIRTILFVFGKKTDGMEKDSEFFRFGRRYVGTVKKNQREGKIDFF
jgi:hypothetical protein